MLLGVSNRHVGLVMHSTVSSFCYAVADLMQIINALDPVCDALAVLACPLNLCDLRRAAATCTCLNATGSQLDMSVLASLSWLCCTMI